MERVCPQSFTKFWFSDFLSFWNFAKSILLGNGYPTTKLGPAQNRGQTILKVPPRSRSDKVWSMISGSRGIHGLSTLIHGDSGVWAFWKCWKRTLRVILSPVSYSLRLWYNVSDLRSTLDRLNIYPLLQRYLSHFGPPCLETWAGGVEKFTGWRKHSGFS